MNRVFIDTNILMDVLDKRENFYTASLTILELANSKNISAFISAISIVNANYICCKKDKNFDTGMLIEYFNTISSIEPLNAEILIRANKIGFSDFEDAIQHETALQCNADCILTRNIKDFEKSKLPIFTPEQFLNIYF